MKRHLKQEAGFPEFRAEKINKEKQSQPLEEPIPLLKLAPPIEIKQNFNLKMFKRKKEKSKKQKRQCLYMKVKRNTSPKEFHYANGMHELSKAKSTKPSK